MIRSAQLNKDGHDVLGSLQGGLIVSCQAAPGEPLHGPDHMTAIARSVVAGGAVAVRVEGSPDVQAVAAAVDVPVIGLWKDGGDGVYITPTFEHAARIAAAGADVVALDATGRPRRDGLSLADTVRRLHDDHGVLVMADVSTREEGLAAAQAGADMVGSTLSGYTPYTRRSDEPDLELVAALSSELDVPVVAEGRIRTPEHARAALESGAWAVVVGGAITRPAMITSAFVTAMSDRPDGDRT